MLVIKKHNYICLIGNSADVKCDSMKYFLDTEFIEGFHKPLFGKRRHFIDLISIGIVAEDGREYYAISNEVDVDLIWNMEDDFVLNNVVKPMFNQYIKDDWGRYKYLPGYCGLDGNFTLRNIKRFFKNKGKSNKQIATDIRYFIFDKQIQFVNKKPVFNNPEFYAYYADYDWVLFCSLFGRMIDLPLGFPMYCRDLKQMLDDSAEKLNQIDLTTHLFTPQKSEKGSWQLMEGASISKDIIDIDDYTLDMKLELLKSNKDYPKQFNEHSAIDDAKWNFEIYKFLTNISRHS